LIPAAVYVRLPIVRTVKRLIPHHGPARSALTVLTALLPAHIERLRRLRVRQAVRGERSTMTLPAVADGR
jgi:hypothetical protein